MTRVDLASLAAAVPADVVARVRDARAVLAATHENPDADTLGAALGLAMLVERLGGRATVVAAEPIPPLYRFLPDVDRIRTEPEGELAYDLIVLLDCATPARIGPLAERHPEWFGGDVPRMVIDHHVSNGATGPLDWVDPDAAATCEMVALLAVRLGIPLDAEDGALAGALMAGIVMDTATFAHPNATPRTLTVSAALVEAGAPLSDISRRIYRTKPEVQLRLFGRVLGRLATAGDGRVVWSTLTDEDLAVTGAIPAMSEGIIDLLAQAEEAEVALLLKEHGAAAVRLSVRTRPGGVDATVLTGRFGGGGHARAAGATVELPLAEAVPVVLAEAERLAAQVRR